MIKFLDLLGQYNQIRGEIDEAIQSVIASSAFIGGEQLRSFEREFAAYCGVEHCVGVANGTDAIEIILEALDLPAGSEVIVPANSFVGSSEPAARSGRRVVFADSTPGTFVLDVEDVRRRITPRTSAIIAVHLYGHPAPMDELLELAHPRGIPVIEDAAQAHGARYRGRSVGSLGRAAAFSFYPGKNLGAYGDGGAITTNDPELAKRCRMIANHGRVAKYDHMFDGRNSRLDNLQAAILRVKLRHLDAWVDARNAVARIYDERLAEVGDLVLPTADPNCRHARHLYVIMTEQRDALAQFLEARGIQTGVHYPTALPKLPAYANLGQQHEPMFANQSDARLLSLPIGEHLQPADVTAVADAIKEFFSRPVGGEGGTAARKNSGRSDTRRAGPASPPS